MDVVFGFVFDFLNRAWSRGHIPALLWCLYGVYIILIQFDWTHFPSESGWASKDGVFWLLSQKEDLISLIVGPVLRLYEYANEKSQERLADKRFVKDTLNVSLNTLNKVVREGISPRGPQWSLKFRTIQEVSPANVFFDKVHENRLMQLSDETTPENAYLAFNPMDVKDQEIRKIVVNYLSSFSSDGHIAKELGFPVNEKTFVFALTNEKFGGHVAFKLRLMVVRENVLRDIYEHWFLETLIEEYTWEDQLKQPLDARVHEVLAARNENRDDGSSLYDGHRLLIRDRCKRPIQLQELTSWRTLTVADRFPLQVSYRHACEKARLQPDDRVTLLGLSGSDLFFNGKTGTCKRRDSSIGGWEVEVDNSSQLKSFHERYLERDCPHVELPSHVNRWYTLKRMAVMYFDESDPDHKWISNSKMTMARAEVPHLQGIQQIVSSLDADLRSRGYLRPREADSASESPSKRRAISS